MKPKLARLLRGLPAWSLGFTLLFSACNRRFEFDLPETAGGKAGAPNETGGSGGPILSGGSGGGNGGTAGTQEPAAAGSSDDVPAGSAGSAGMGDQACGIHAQCPAGQSCDQGECYECVADANCLAPNLPRCNSRRHRCVACVGPADCPTHFTCDALAGRCLKTCDADNDCPLTAHGCDERRGVCYQCDEDEECAASASGKLCASDGSGCVECRAESNCPGRHCDQLAGRCVDCRYGRDCASGLCASALGQCLTP